MSNDPKKQAMSKAADPGKSIHLSASAGSGKTRALKERYLALLELLDRLGLNIDQAVAITFTDKAAAEIKERVMHDLPETALKKIIRGRQDLRISTVHSFCMNLLKRYPLEAGLPPDFSVLDGRDQAYKLQKAVEDALEESDRDPAITAPLRHLNADELIARVHFLLSIRSRLKRMEIDAGGPDSLLQALYSGLKAEDNEAEMKELITSAGWRSNLRSMEQILKTLGDYYDECMAKEHLRLAVVTDIDSASRTAQSLASVYFNKDGSLCKKAYITKSACAVKDREAYEKIFFRIQEMLKQFLSLHARIRSAIEAVGLIKVFQLAEKKYELSKLREGLLDFDDLEIYAYGLLQGADSPDILYWLDRKILHFLVDEFQDTSDIQWSILSKLTEEIFAGQGADKGMPPTLFVVGDEKQSIYRFREANYRLINTVRQKMEKNIPPESREMLTLDKNFRSTPEVIDTVNKVFGKLWGKAYQPSEAERTGHTGSVRLIELDPSASEEQSSGPTEAQVLAREIKSFATTGTVIYEKSGSSGESDKKGIRWTERAAGYGDCAILIQSRTRLKEYEAALQAENIPYRVIGGIGFYEEAEIQALINVLFFLWNRDDKLALAAALKSPLFGLNHKQIFDLLQDDRTLVEGLRHQRPGDWDLLHGWMNLAGLVPLAGLIHRIVEDTAAYVRFGKRNRQAIFNIDKLLDTAREFDRRGYTTLQDFVEWVKNIRQTEQREAAADMNLPGFEGSVSILTVHKAKGLEYPVVFLPGMNQQSRSFSSGPLAIIEESGGTFRMAAKDSGSPVYSELWEREHEELLREHQRLFYVAMTRARDHLIMTASLNKGNKPVKQNTWLDYLHQASPEPLFSKKITEQGFTVYNYGNTISSRARGGAVRNQEQQKNRDVDIDKLIRNLSAVPRSQSLEWRKATDFIVQEDSIERLFAQNQPAVVSPLIRGNVLHRCLEELTKTGTYVVDNIIEEYRDMPPLSKDARQQFIADVARVMNTVVSEPDHAWIFERQQHAYSELPFLYRKDQNLVSGVIDRVVIEEGTGYVIDYKSILIENDSALASWLDHYRPQVRIYCEAVKEMFRLSKVEGYLLFLDSSRLAVCAEL